MALVRWQYRNPYHDRRNERTRVFVFGAHTVTIAQNPAIHIDLHTNTGHLVWDGAYVLAKFVHDHASGLLALRGKTCLELGAGSSALVSIVAGLAGGAASVTATDMAEYLPLIRANAERNAGTGSDPSRPPLSVRELVWQVIAHCLLPEDIAPVDLVFGSEILYLPGQHGAILTTLEQLMHADSAAFFVYKDRNLGERRFAEMAAARGLFAATSLDALIDDEFRSSSSSDENNNNHQQYHLLRITKIKAL
ncbi:Methyltransferase-like protein 21B [Coemansia sp. BCRC 34490]|nr:Methyltransferase-like protein 21B [Coemansia sp. BCRC 34490]